MLKFLAAPLICGLIVASSGHILSIAFDDGISKEVWDLLRIMSFALGLLMFIFGLIQNYYHVREGKKPLGFNPSETSLD